MGNLKQIKILQNSSHIKNSFAWSFAMLLLIATMAVSSYADTLVPDHSSADVCATCPFSHSREKSSGDQVPTADDNHCLAHFHCHHQSASLKILSLNNLGKGYRLTSVKNSLDLSLFVSPIFHPPQIHI